MTYGRMSWGVGLLAAGLLFGCDSSPKKRDSDASPRPAKKRKKETARSESKASSSAALKEAPTAKANLKDIDPVVGLTYYATRNGNNPMIFLERGEKRLVVVGREHRNRWKAAPTETFASANVDDALASYENLIVALGFAHEGAQPPPAPDDGPKSLSEVRGDAGASFDPLTVEETELLYNTAPNQAWRMMSGQAAGSADGRDVPVMVATPRGVLIFAPGVDREFAWADSKAAFEAFKQVCAGSAK